MGVDPGPLPFPSNRLDPLNGFAVYPGRLNLASTHYYGVRLSMCSCKRKAAPARSVQPESFVWADFVSLRSRSLSRRFSGSSSPPLSS